MTNFKDTYGPWAIVTGASSGIGESFAHALAAKKLNLVLAARRLERLEKLAEQLQQTHGIEVLPIRADLTEADFLDKMLADIGDRPVGLLVNNAGIAVDRAFIKQEVHRHQQMLRLNCEAPMLLAHHYGRIMAEKGKGGIIFTGSMSGYFPAPYLGHYAATKAYILSLAESMNYEMAKKGVQVQVLGPGFTKTEMNEAFHDKMDMMTPEAVVELSLRKLRSGKASIIPGFKNIVQARMLPRLFGRQFVSRMAARMMGK
ncbi:MAG: SDR family oxidoreductase [Bacteroidota bacterium]